MNYRYIIVYSYELIIFLFICLYVSMFYAHAEKV